jgi:hypothetical protein
MLPGQVSLGLAGITADAKKFFHGILLIPVYKIRQLHYSIETR